MSKCQALSKVFEDAYKSPLSLIVLDDIERLLEYVAIGPRFSNVVLQALLILLKRAPPPGRKLLVIGTTSLPEVFGAMGLLSVFNVTLHCPLLSPENVKQVLAQLDAFKTHEIDSAVALLEPETPIKKLFMLLEMARHGGGGHPGRGREHPHRTVDRVHGRPGGVVGRFYVAGSGDGRGGE